MKKIYLGYKDGKYEIVRSETTPTNESHGHLYAGVVGPFRTLRGAKFMQKYGLGNPHCQTVSQAEKLGTLEKMTSDFLLKKIGFVKGRKFFRNKNESQKEIV